MRWTSPTPRSDIGRFRVNVFRQLGSIAIALRFIPDRVYSLEELGAPAIARDFALLPRGLVLLTGPTGSGKSTTLTAMVDIINELIPAHIITIEDPIEFHHESKRALVHQREVGTDTGLIRRGAATSAAAGPRRHPHR